MTVRIKTGDEKVLRVILAYDPQENEDIEEKINFLMIQVQKLQDVKLLVRTSF